ncbi:MAG: hypothetical protein ACYTG0_05040 [Planctomycetota bacterium]
MPGTVHTNIGTFVVAGATDPSYVVKLNGEPIPSAARGSLGEFAHTLALQVGQNSLKLDVESGPGTIVATASKTIVFDPNMSTSERRLLYVDVVPAGSAAPSLNGTVVLDLDGDAILGLLDGQHVRGVSPDDAEIYLHDRTVVSTANHQPVRTLPFSQDIPSNSFVAARGDYEVATYADHENAMLDYWNTSATDLARFQYDVAQGDHAWAQNVRDARNSLHGTVSTDYITYAGDLNGAEHPYDDALADVGFTYDDAVTDPARVLDVAVADAWADWTYDRVAAELARDRGQTAKEARHKAEVAEAERVYQNELAAANLAWVTGMSQSEADLYLESITQAEYDAQEAGHDAVKAAADTLAHRNRSENVGIANVTRATGLRTVETTFADDLRTAETGRLDGVIAAQGVFDTNEGLLDTAWISSVSTEDVTLANSLATVYHDQTARLGAAAVAFQSGPTGLGAAFVQNLTAYATAEAAYQKTVAAQKATDAEARAIALGTPQSEYEAAYARAFSDWVAGLENDYVDYVAAFAQGEADYSGTLAQKLAWLDDEYADHHVTHTTQVAPLEATWWSDSENRTRDYLNASFQREDTYFRDFVNADYGHASGSLGVGGQKIIDLETAEQLFQIATVDEDPAAQSDKDQALLDADDAYQLSLAGEDLTWTTDVAGEDKTFRTGQATDDKNFSIDLSSHEKTFYQSRASHQKTRNDADTTSLSTFWNDEAAAASARFLSRCDARADFETAQYDAAATALTTFATTLGTPWAQFRADLAAARRDWWWNGCTGEKTYYLDWAADVNTEAEQYQTNVGAKFVVETANITSADVTWSNTASDALHTYATETTTARETYVHAISPKIEDYHVAVATADRDAVDQDETFDYQGAIDSALKAYAQGQATDGGDYSVAQATAKRDFIDRIEGDNLVGTGAGGANKTWQATIDGALEAFNVYDAQEPDDRVALRPYGSRVGLRVPA